MVKEPCIQLVLTTSSPLRSSPLRSSPLLSTTPTRIVDDGVRNVTDALKKSGRWDDTLLVVTSDNGGIMKGNNYPLRGLKATVWEGGTRVMAFVAGGHVEALPGFEDHLKNTTNERFIHVSDWYATLSTMVGVDPTDNATYDGVVRPIDGIDVWPLITGK